MSTGCRSTSKALCSGESELAPLKQTSTTVFKAGEQGYKVFRIPTIIRCANLDLLAFCEARQGREASEIDLVLKRSKDHGKTWGDLLVVKESDDFKAIIQDQNLSINIGNPAPVVDLLDPARSGRLWAPFHP